MRPRSRPGPREDVEAIVERLRRAQLPLLRNVSWLVYDQYLKANRVDEGIRSYGAVVTLILRARFREGWIPVRRAVEAELAARFMIRSRGAWPGVGLLCFTRSRAMSSGVSRPACM